MILTIVANNDTYLKKTTSQSHFLPEDQKVSVKKGQTFKLVDYSEADKGHYYVTLDYDAGDWYIWSGDWYLPWEDNLEEDRAIETDTPSRWEDIEWNDFNAKVSKYFTVGEATNYSNKRIPKEVVVKKNIFNLAQELDKVREAWGSPIKVTSWYRPPAVNRAVGGARNSQHLYGKAADIRPVQGNIYKFQDWLDKTAWTNKALGYGAKKGFVHLDLRPGRIRWNY